MPELYRIAVVQVVIRDIHEGEEEQIIHFLYDRTNKICLILEDVLRPEHYDFKYKLTPENIPIFEKFIHGERKARASVGDPITEFKFKKLTDAESTYLSPALQGIQDSHVAYKGSMDNLEERLRELGFYKS